MREAKTGEGEMAAAAPATTPPPSPTSTSSPLAVVAGGFVRLALPPRRGGEGGGKRTGAQRILNPLGYSTYPPRTMYPPRRRSFLCEALREAAVDSSALADAPPPATGLEMGGDDGAVLAPPVASTGRGRLRRAAEPRGPPPDSGRLPAGTGAKAAFPSAFEGASAVVQLIPAGAAPPTSADGDTSIASLVAVGATSSGASLVLSSDAASAAVASPGPIGGSPMRRNRSETEARWPQRG